MNFEDRILLVLSVLLTRGLVYVCSCLVWGHVVLLHFLFSYVIRYQCEGRLNYRNHGLVYDIMGLLDRYQSLKMVVNSAFYISR